MLIDITTITIAPRQHLRFSIIVAMMPYFVCRCRRYVERHANISIACRPLTSAWFTLSHIDAAIVC